MKGNNNKGGRPPKSMVCKKAYRVNIKMNTEGYYTLKAKACEAGVTLSEYIRLAVSNSNVKQRFTLDQLDHIRKICGMANNLNQIAHKANITGYEDVRLEYLFLAEKIDKLLTFMQK